MPAMLGSFAAMMVTGRQTFSGNKLQNLVLLLALLLQLLLLMLVVLQLMLLLLLHNKACKKLLVLTPSYIRGQHFACTLLRCHPPA